MTCKTDGTIGIGIASPTASLDLNGSFKLGVNQLFREKGWGNSLGGNIVFVPSDFGNNNAALEIIYPDANTIRFGTDYSGHLSGGHYLDIQFGRDNTPYLTIKDGGNIGIGTPCPKYKLDVLGTIRAQEVKVDLQGGCGADFVFKNDYKLMDLKVLENFVKTNQHLPEIASEQEMVDNGVNIKDLQIKLLQKVEELTLYTIEQNKKNELQSNEIICVKRG